MIQAYNFIASWQLFPEKGTYEYDDRPKSGMYKIAATENKNELLISISWVTLENQAFASDYLIPCNGEQLPLADNAAVDYVTAHLVDVLRLEITFIKNEQPVITVLNELMPNGYLKVTRQGSRTNGTEYTNTEIYHKQLSVMPYSASVSGAVIKPTEEGVIRYKALTAMEEQTNMQLDQIRRQIELLAIQAQEIQMRKELSMIIYGAKLSFVPVIGHTYYLYQKADALHVLSLISPKEYGSGTGPYQKFVAPVKLLADHTWMEV